MNKRRMFKYPLFDMKSVTDDCVTIKAPWPSPAQHVAMQGTIIMLWAISGDMLPEKDRTFLLFGTSQLIQGDLSYVGTVHDRSFVWHIFEKF